MSHNLQKWLTSYSVVYNRERQMITTVYVHHVNLLPKI